MTALTVILALASVTPAVAASCESLKSLSLPNTTITAAETVAAGQSSVAYCRVAATLKPTADSDIAVEVWLPASGWNGKYQAVGNGGWSGSINSNAMLQALRRGYATSSTNTGHNGGSASFALGHPEKLIDYAWRSEHEMAVKAKAIISAFYGDAPRLSYWNGCSAG
ncbi:MAG TPA: tannase/feruloyl esterase family alpha/beta hydrolase, partial [Bryobacteraceae bacterium]